MGIKRIQWTKPPKKKIIDKDMPYNKDVVTKTAKIGKDSRDLFIVRFPREISDAARLSQGDLIEYTVEKPIPFEEKDVKSIKIAMKLIRSD